MHEFKPTLEQEFSGDIILRKRLGYFGVLNPQTKQLTLHDIAPGHKMLASTKLPEKAESVDLLLKQKCSYRIENALYYCSVNRKPSQSTKIYENPRFTGTYITTLNGSILLVLERNERKTRQKHLLTHHILHHLRNNIHQSHRG